MTSLVGAVTVAVCAVAGVVLGQAVAEPWSPLITYGPLGVLVVLYVLGYIPSRAELLRQIERAERAEQQRDSLTEKAAAEMIPLLGEVQRTMIPTLERVATAVERMSDRLDRLEQTNSSRARTDRAR